MKTLTLMKIVLLGGCALALLVAGCAPVAPTPRPPPVDQEALRVEMQNLPRAEVGDGGIVYPQGFLFSPGAVLFYAGGPEALEPLAAFLLKHPRIRWQGTVRAESVVSEEQALALATVRARLLQRYLQHKGLGAGRLSLSAEAGAGPDLALRQIAEGQDDKVSSSSREKE
jgi:hypothetical protein